jgi:hypothetical protein
MRRAPTEGPQKVFFWFCIALRRAPIVFVAQGTRVCLVHLRCRRSHTAARHHRNNTTAARRVVNAPLQPSTTPPAPLPPLQLGAATDAQACAGACAELGELEGFAGVQCFEYKDGGGQQQCSAKHNTLGQQRRAHAILLG